MKEKWREIPGFNGYLASSDGKIKSVKRVIFRKNGTECTINERIIKQHLMKIGYYQLSIFQKKYYAHRLIALAFIENPDNKRTVNHKNGIRSDNRVENLEWLTYSENHYHSYRKLNRKNNSRIGELNNQSKLSSSDVVDIRKKLEEGIPLKQIAELYSVTPENVIHIKKKSTWKHL